MFSTTLTYYTHRALALLACTGAVLALTAGPVQAAHGGQPFSCTIQQPANNSSFNAGEPVDFSGKISSGDKPYQIVWNFGDGTIVNEASNERGKNYTSNQTHTYAAVAQATDYNVLLDADDSGDPSHHCSSTITVTILPAGDQPPTADPDNYTTPQDTQLTVAAPGVLDNDTDPENDPLIAVNDIYGGQGSVSLNLDGSFIYTPAPGFTGIDSFTYQAQEDPNQGTEGKLSNVATVSIDVTDVGENGLTARGDNYATPIGKLLNARASRVSGVLYNDFGGTPPYAIISDLGGTGSLGGTFALNTEGGFTYDPSTIPAPADNTVDIFEYTIEDAVGNTATAKVAVTIYSDQPDFKITMNYELGMHCTGFEFAYCCVLPPYNSIITQVTKPQSAPSPTDNGSPPAAGSNGQADMYPRVLDASRTIGLDPLGRETVLRDFGESGEFKKYMVRYEHDAQPRLEGQGKPTPLDGQGNPLTLISDVEGNSLLMHGTRVDSVEILANRALRYGQYAGAAYGVLQGDDCPDGNLTGCSLDDDSDNYANAWLNHFYIYDASAEGLEGGRLCVDPDLNGEFPVCHTDAQCVAAGAGETCGNSQEDKKIRLGTVGGLVYPKNVGPALHPMGPDGNESGFDNVLTFSTDHGTVVYTQMKVLENLPIMLTSPRIWEALGLPLTPFEDDINFFGDPGAVDEDTIRPYVAMKAHLHEAICDGDGNCTPGNAVTGSNDQPVIGFGTAPIDIPNCERCHSAPSLKADGITPNLNSPNYRNATTFNPGVTPTGLGLEALTDLEYNFWMAYYDIMPTAGDSDWYARLKAAAINMMALHDSENGTIFTANYPGVDCSNNPDQLDPTIDPNSYLCSNLPLGPNGEPNLQDLTNQTSIPQNTRLGFESVICQKCHADNVIAVVKSGCTEDPATSDIAPLCQDASGGDNANRKIIQPITEAIHWNHRGDNECVNGECGVITFSDGLGRDGGCQGCHPAHRSDGVTDGYPITLDGDNAQEGGDNRLAPGGCFVGRDVHSNPLKDIDGAETPEYLNAVGQYLSAEVYNKPNANTGIWCTNCHNQLGQELWRAENVYDLVNGRGICTDGVTACRADKDCKGQGNSCAINNIRAKSLPEIANEVAGGDLNLLYAWLDPTDAGVGQHGDMTHSIWNPDVIANPDASVALIEVSTENTDPPNRACGFNGDPSTSRAPFALERFGGAQACLNLDGDPAGAPTGAGDPSVRILDFCTTADCEAAANAVLANEGTCVGGNHEGQACTIDGTGNLADCTDGEGSCEGNRSQAFAAPFDAATDGRDHWLAPGEPHCADCHQAPFVEQSGNLNPFPPFNYPRKASLMRYSRGHQDLTCQSCHESIHGLYPVSPTIDSTSYAQAAALNPDGSHGPLKCATCHEVDGDGLPTWSNGSFFNNYDEAVVWAHTLTQSNSIEACVKCHNDAADGGGQRIEKISETKGKWLRHSYLGRIGRKLMDNVEIDALGHVSGDPDTNGDGVNDRDATEIANTVCAACHSLENGPPAGGFLEDATCGSSIWKSHLIQGRVSSKVWEFISEDVNGSTCGW